MATSGGVLQEHLIEHSFSGCEDRGYSCYICSSVFTAAAGLQLHMDEVHGSGAKPYDCHMCAAKFFFRAELEHHGCDHEMGRIRLVSQPKFGDRTQRSSAGPSSPEHMDEDQMSEENNPDRSRPSSSVGGHDEITEKQQLADDEEEYIEVEKLAEIVATDPCKTDGSDGESDSEETPATGVDAIESDQ